MTSQMKNKDYKKDFVRRNTYKNTEPNVTNNDATPVTTVTIPYVRGTSETTSVEAVLSRQRELSESAKDNIKSRITSTILTDSNLTKDEQQALKRLKTDENIVILPADKGRVTVVMDKTDYYDKMDTLVNDK